MVKKKEDNLAKTIKKIGKKKKKKEGKKKKSGKTY